MAVSSELMHSTEKHVLVALETSVLATYIDDRMVHLRMPAHLLENYLVPGVGKGAAVELVLLRDLGTLTDHLPLLGDSWLADVLNVDRVPWLGEIIKSSALMSSWDRSEVWLASPLERRNKQEYCMPLSKPLLYREAGTPLMDCKTAILADQRTGVVDSTLALCSNSVEFLMGGCRLGCSRCSTGLGSAPPK